MRVEEIKQDWNLKMTFEGIVAVGLLTKNDIDVLGPGFTRLWPVDETPTFSGLLRAIDEAERNLRRTQHAPPS